MKSKISKFFDNISIVSSRKINRLECKPIPYWGDLYVSGFKIDDSQNVMVHFKIVKKVDLTEAQETQVEYYMMNPDSDFWLPYELVDETSIDETFDEYINEINNTSQLHILHVSYKKNSNTYDENMIFASKRVACKEAMNYRKLYTGVLLNFFVIGEPSKKEKQISVFEFATTALE
jgi:hypothetical protein